MIIKKINLIWKEKFYKHFVKIMKIAKSHTGNFLAKRY